MNTSYTMDSYRSHDLNIAMRTSSGDVIKMDFANSQSSSLSHNQDENGSSSSMSFSSMQSFEFSVESNGISKQDQKEIDAFMKIAQPFIDDFLKELKDEAPKSPVTKLAHEIASIFEPNQSRDDNQKNHVKNSIVHMFDESMKQYTKPENNGIAEEDKGNKLEAHSMHKPEKIDTASALEKMFQDAQKLLEKTLKEFDDFGQNIYA